MRAEAWRRAAPAPPAAWGLLLLAPAAVALAIFLGSARSGWYVGTQLPGLADVFPGIPIHELDFYVKKVVHAAEYFTLTTAVLFGLFRLWPAAPGPVARTSARAASPPGQGVWLRALLAVGVAAAFAVSDELHQAFVPGRFPSVRDVLIDVSGSAAAVGAWAVFGEVRWRYGARVSRVRPAMEAAPAGSR